MTPLQHAPQPPSLQPPAPDAAPAAHADDWPAAAVLRRRDAFPPELRGLLETRAAAVRGGAPGPATLDALLAPADTWPVRYAVTILREIAALVDEAAAAGTAFGALTPRCVAVDGANLVVVPGEHPAAADPAFVAPEHRRGGAATSDALGAQYGLALIACALLASTVLAPEPAALAELMMGGSSDAGDARRRGAAAERARVRAELRRVVDAAHSPDRARRYVTAGVFAAAVEAACAGWVEPTADEERAAARPWGAWRRVAALGVAAGAVGLGGVGIGWSAAQRADASDAGGGPPVVVTAAGYVAPPLVLVPPGAPRRLAAPAAGGAAEAARAEQARDQAGADDAPREEPPTVGRLGALVASVAVPRADVDVAARRDVSLPGDFVTGELVRTSGQSLAARLPDPRADTPTVVPRGVAAQSGAVRVAGEAPRYPEALLDQRLEGEVVARFEVDAAGRVDPASVAVVRSTHPLFTQAVRRSLREARYLAGDSAGPHVGQWMQLTFRFDPVRTARRR